jgi:hypothetical protein
MARKILNARRSFICFDVFFVMDAPVIPGRSSRLQMWSRNHQQADGRQRVPKAGTQQRNPN